MASDNKNISTETAVIRAFIDCGIIKTTSGKFRRGVIEKMTFDALMERGLMPQNFGVNEHNPDGLLILSSNGCTSYIRDALQQLPPGKLHSVVNATAKNGITALMCAVKNGHLDTAVLLMDYGAGINIRNVSGATALTMAVIEYKNMEKGMAMVTELIDRLADVNAESEWGSVLFIAAQVGDTALGKVLIDAGAGVDYVKGNKNILMNAIENRNTEFAVLMAENGLVVGKEELRATMATQGFEMFNALLELTDPDIIAEMVEEVKSLRINAREEWQKPDVMDKMEMMLMAHLPEPVVAEAATAGSLAGWQDRNLSRIKEGVKKRVFELFEGGNDPRDISTILGYKQSTIEAILSERRTAGLLKGGEIPADESREGVLMAEVRGAAARAPGKNEGKAAAEKLDNTPVRDLTVGQLRELIRDTVMEAIGNVAHARQDSKLRTGTAARIGNTAGHTHRRIRRT